MKRYPARAAEGKSRLCYLGTRSDRQTAMHKHLSCTLPRLSSPEPVAIVRVSGCLPGLHPIDLYWFRIRMIDLPFFAISGNASPDLSIPDRIDDLTE
jgi:hypothetical protein